MISVVVPTKDRCSLLPRAMRSVLSQTGVDLELIVVDDGSADATEETVRAFDDPRVRYLRHETPQGACAARNTGIRAARGEYIAFQDSDDEWLPGKLQAQAETLARTGADIVFCAFNSIVDGALTRRFPDGEVAGGFLRYEDFLIQNWASTPTILGKAECFRAEGFDTTYPRFQDWEIMLRLLRKYRVFYDPAVYVNQHLQGDSISKSPQKGLDALEMLFARHREALRANPAAAVRLLNRRAIYAVQCGKSPRPVFAEALRMGLPASSKARFALKWLRGR